MLPEPELHTLRRQWTIEPVPAGLADRIVRHALAQEQRLPLLARLKKAMAPAEHHAVWKGGFAVAACVMIALVALDGGHKAKYQKPMDQLVEQMMWGDYDY